MRSGGKPPKSMRELIAAAERSLQKRHMRGGAIEKEYKRQVPVIGGGNVDMEDRVQKRADMVRDFKAGGLGGTTPPSVQARKWTRKAPFCALRSRSA